MIYFHHTYHNIPSSSALLRIPLSHRAFLFNIGCWPWRGYGLLCIPFTEDFCFFHNIWYSNAMPSSMWGHFKNPWNFLVFVALPFIYLKWRKTAMVKYYTGNGKLLLMEHLTLESCGLFSNYFSHCLSIVELRPSFLISTGCVVPLRGDWATFRHPGSRPSVINQGKIPWNTPSWPGIEPGPRIDQTVRSIHSPAELSWLNYVVTHWLIPSLRKTDNPFAN